MKTPVIIGTSGALTVIAAAILLWPRNDSADDAGKSQEARSPHKRETAAAPSAPTTPRTPAEMDEARRKYKDELREKVKKEGLATNLKEASAKAMADYLRQDLFIQFITVSLEAD